MQLGVFYRINETYSFEKREKEIMKFMANWMEAKVK